MTGNSIMAFIQLSKFLLSVYEVIQSLIQKLEKEKLIPKKKDKNYFYVATRDVSGRKRLVNVFLYNGILIFLCVFFLTT